MSKAAFMSEFTRRASAGEWLLWMLLGGYIA